MSRFGSPQHVVTVYIRRLESWQKISPLNHTLVSFSTFLKQLIQTFHNLNFTADLHSSTVLRLAKEKLVAHHLLLHGLNILLEITCQHLICSISNNGWRLKQNYWKHSKQLVIDPTTTNFIPTPPSHKRHPNSNPLLALSVLRRTLSTNDPRTQPLP